MDRAIEIWEGKGGAHGSIASKVVQGTRHHRALWNCVLYAITIVLVLACRGKAVFSTV